MDTNKLREQFESALVSMHMATGMPENDARSFLEVGSNGYRSVFTKAAWWAWQASREAIVIELPEPQQKPEIGASQYREGKSDGIESGIIQCIKAIERQGFKVEA